MILGSWVAGAASAVIAAAVAAVIAAAGPIQCV